MSYFWPKKPEATEPVIERYEGENNPYRGIQQHGIEPDNQPRSTEDELDYGAEHHMTYAEPVELPDPIPVYIVPDGERTLRRLRPVRALSGGLGGSARQILGSDSTRMRATIKNLDTTTNVVYVGPRPEYAKVTTGYPIAAGAEYVTNSEDELYAYADIVDGVEVAIAVEYVQKVV